MKRLREKFKRLLGTFEDRASPVPPNAAAAATKIESNVRSTNIEPKAVLCPKEKQENRDSRLESLPPEIRRQLLSILDLPQLKLLVHASPTFHEQYLLDRRYFLCRSIEKTLGSATLDAYAVYQSAAQAEDTEQTTGWVPNSYIEQSRQRYLPLANKLTQEEAISITVFYFCYVKPIAEYYTLWLLRNLAEARKDSRDHHEEVSHIPTNMEVIRLTRAIYRFQLLCQVSSSVRNTWPRQHEIVLSFIEVLEPWEIEEMLSFYQFAQDVYDNVFNKIRWDLHPDNPKFDNQQRPPTPYGAFHLDSLWDRGNYVEGTALRGLSLLYKVLFKIDGHEQLVSTIEQHIVRSYIPLNASEGVLGPTQQSRRRSNHPSERDRMEEQRVAFPFRGDSDEPDMPPLAWTIMWYDTYSNLYGGYIPDELRCWGYVFWDAATLEVTGGKSVLNKHWEKPWDASDPRDEMVYL